MQYPVSHVYSYTTALVLSQMASEAISEHLISKISLGEHAPHTPPYSLVCLCMHTYTSDNHETPLLKILATDLDLKIIKNGKGYRDGMPKSIETR